MCSYVGVQVPDALSAVSFYENILSKETKFSKMMRESSELGAQNGPPGVPSRPASAASTWSVSQHQTAHTSLPPIPQESSVNEGLAGITRTGYDLCPYIPLACHFDHTDWVG